MMCSVEVVEPPGDRTTKEHAMPHLAEVTDTAEPRSRRGSISRPRACEQIVAELRGLGGLVLEQGLLAQGGVPLASLVEWQRALILELGQPMPPRPRGYAQMLRQIVEVSRAVPGPLPAAA